MGRRFQDEREARRKSRPWHWHEHKLARRMSNRKVRHDTDAQLRKGDDTALPKPPRTSGWLTW